MNGTSLAPHHRSMLLGESAIAPQVVEARGYWTVKTKAELKGLGFGSVQCNVPGLLIPIYSPAGKIVLHQFRPDVPRTKKKSP